MRFLTFLLLIAVVYLGYDRYKTKTTKVESYPSHLLRAENFDPDCIMPPTENAPNKYVIVSDTSPKNQIWYTEYYGTMEIAEQERKECLCLVSTSNCPPCEKLKKELKENTSLSNKYILLAIDNISSKEVVEKLKVTQFPTLFLITPDYKITHKIQGYKNQDGIAACLSKKYCYCCDNPDCKCGENCQCPNCDCTKEVKTVVVQPQQIQYQQPIIPQVNYRQYQPQPSFQPQYQNYQPPQNHFFGGGMPFFGGGGFGGGMMRGGGGC